MNPLDIVLYEITQMLSPVPEFSSLWKQALQSLFWQHLWKCLKPQVTFQALDFFIQSHSSFEQYPA